jgi:hypothetical protein
MRITKTARINETEQGVAYVNSNISDNQKQIAAVQERMEYRICDNGNCYQLYVRGVMFYRWHSVGVYGTFFEALEALKNKFPYIQIDAERYCDERPDCKD